MKIPNDRRTRDHVTASFVRHRLDAVRLIAAFPGLSLGELADLLGVDQPVLEMALLEAERGGWIGSRRVEGRVRYFPIHRLDPMAARIRRHLENPERRPILQALLIEPGAKMSSIVQRTRLSRRHVKATVERFDREGIVEVWRQEAHLVSPGQVAQLEKIRVLGPPHA